MTVQNRGGFPAVRNFTVSSDGLVDATPAAALTTEPQLLKYVLPAASVHIIWRAKSFPLRVYFSRTDFDLDQDYLEVEADESIPVPMEITEFWARGVGGSSDVRMIITLKG